MALGNRKNVVENQVEVEEVVAQQAAPVVETPTSESAVAEPQVTQAVETVPAQAAAPVQTPTVVHSNPAPAPAAQTGVVAMMADMASQGFGGLELDYTSFVGISLDGETFQTSEEDDIDGREGFVVQIQHSRTKYALRSNDGRQEDVEVIYTYEKDEHLTPGSNAFNKLAEWHKEGRDLGEIKEYTEIWALMIDDGSLGGELVGQLVSLSIPPTSRGRLTGMIAMEQMKNKRGPADYHIRCTAGKKVKKARFPFIPWSFKVEA